MAQVLNLTPQARHAFDSAGADLAKIFGDRLTCFVATGHSSGLALVTSITTDDLEACGALTHTWHHEGLTTPLLLTVEEFRRSLDTFALEFQAILDRHVVIRGDAPFGAASIAEGDLRHACEVQAKGHLIHLRQGWMDAAGHHAALARLLTASAAPLRSLLGNVARLHRTPAASKEELASFAEHTIGLSADFVLGVFALEKDPTEAGSLTARLPEYLAATERLWSIVDAWHA